MSHQALAKIVSLSLEVAVKIIDAIREINRLFPESVIIDNGLEIDYFFEKEEMIIRTPDRSEPACEAVKALKKAGLSGSWRSKALN